MAKEDGRYIDTEEAGRRLGVKQARVRQLLIAGRLKGRKREQKPRPVWEVLASSVDSFERGPMGRPKQR